MIKSYYLFIFLNRALASSSQLSCRTSAAPYPSYVVGQLTLMIDGANFTLPNPFLYTLNPTVSRIEPLQSFFSGGRLLYVSGSQFISVQQARLLVMVRRGSRATSNLRTPFATAWPPYLSRVVTTERPTTAGDGVFFDSHRLINESVCSIVCLFNMPSLINCCGFLLFHILVFRSVRYCPKRK